MSQPKRAPKRKRKKRAAGCNGTSKRTRKPCGNPPMIGGLVCADHGGKAPQTLKKAKERIREYVAEMVDPDRVLQEAGRLAMADITLLYDDKGKLLPKSQWPDTVKGSVKSAETIRGNLDDTDGKSDKVVRVIMRDSKVKSLEMLFKHLGLFEADKLEVNIIGDLEDRLAGGRKRVAHGKRG